MLKVVHLVCGYGALRVIHGVSVHLRAGELVTLVGANGAGKSTLLRSIAGLVTPLEGRVLLRGRDMARQPCHRIATAGLTLVPEGRGLFPGLSVRDNLRMGGYPRRLRGQALARRIEAVVADFPMLGERLEERAGHLSGGQQQMLAIARALVGEPDVLLLDEPSTGLAPKMVVEVFAQILALKRAGKTIMLAEQNVREALRLADRAYVLQTGRVVLEGAAADVAASAEVRRAYLGL